MQISEVAIGNHESIEDELSALQKHIAEYSLAFNDEGIWLFLATLGCCSVPNDILQLGAFALTAILFGERLANKQKRETQPTAELVKAVEHRIATEILESDSQKARLYDLANFRAKELSMVKSLKSMKVFIICWLFYWASFACVLFHLS
jgi:hypothetical protein